MCTNICKDNNFIITTNDERLEKVYMSTRWQHQKYYGTSIMIE